jgi:hypothetical protein
VEKPKVAKKRILHLMEVVNSRNSCRLILRILLPLHTFFMSCVIFGNIIYTPLEIQIYVNITQERKMIFTCQIVTHQLLRKKSAINIDIKLYNRLSLERRQSGGFNDFKHKLKLFLLDHPFNDRLCGLVVRVLGYRSGGPGSIPGITGGGEKK